MSSPSSFPPISIFQFQYSYWYQYQYLNISIFQEWAPPPPLRDLFHLQRPGLSPLSPTSGTILLLIIIIIVRLFVYKIHHHHNHHHHHHHHHHHLQRPGLSPLSPTSDTILLVDNFDNFKVPRTEAGRAGGNSKADVAQAEKDILHHQGWINGDGDGDDVGDDDTNYI